ncbi:FKBP-type peptidyl-prolyl cis-trans isomerase [Sphingomonas sp. FW199]|uniref:FKBP-type peptidyl-prolyl cis-trans isomerase n=1 Tax=Sphingomonas sp. FW199 TaxID=3400217 RepID=UPI003CEE8AD9
MSATAVPIPPVKRSYVAWIWIGVVAAIALAILLARFGATDPVTRYLSSNASRSGVVTTASGLQYEVLSPGQGDARPSEADVALINYVGTFTDGKEFDRSQQPVPFPVAPGASIPGFSEALKLMPRGSKYRIWIKPELGYGAPDIVAKLQPGSPQADLAKKVLVFEVDMLEFMPEQMFRQMQMQMMGPGGPGGPGAGGPPPGAGQ